MSAVILCFSSRPGQVQEILNLLIEAELADCEISVLYPRDGDGADSGELELPGLEPLLEAGTVVAALNQEREESSDEDLAQLLLEFGLSRHTARRYHRRIKAGEVLIAVRCQQPASCERVRDLVEQAGAEAIDGREAH
jgi:hypothetical protein